MSQINREASIHITESRLAIILTELLYDNPPGELKVSKKAIELANEILIRSKRYSLSTRNILVSNDRLAKQAEKVQKASLDHTMTMAKVIFQVRKTMRHRGIEISKPGTRDWPFIKNITKNAEEFATEEFKDQPIHVAFKYYIQEAMKDMKTFSLARIQSTHAKIMDGYAARKELASDNNQNFTERAFNQYNKMIIDQVGMILTDYSKEPKDYKYFMEVGKECKKLKVSPEDYIKSQFEGLAWTNGVPTPNQLTGSKALERLQKYLFENKMTLSEKPDEINHNFVNRLKNIRQK